MLRGTLIHEIINLPFYWSKIARVDTSGLKVEKHLYGNQRRQYYLKVSGPEKSIMTPEKVVIYFHGGGWMFGTPEQFLQNAQVFTDLGYTVYMPSYRRLPYYQMNDIRSDLTATFKHITHQHNSLIKETIMAGMSAGGHLAALLSLDMDIDWRNLYNLPYPSKFIGIGAPLDLSEMYGWYVERLAGKKHSEVFKRNNPIHFLPQAKPIELFILSAGRDGFVPYVAKKGFVKKAEDLGLRLQQHHFADATHLEIARWSIPESRYNKLVVNYLRE